MKALTVWQPWASLIAIKAKPYEFRGWKPPRSIIGRRIAIHAGVRPVRKSEVLELLGRLRGGDPKDNPCLKPDLAIPALERVLASLTTGGGALFGSEENPGGLPLGHVVCTAIVGEPKRGDLCAEEFSVIAGNDSDRDEHYNWGWPMQDVRALMPPIPARGSQGLWDIFLHEASS